MILRVLQFSAYHSLAHQKHLVLKVMGLETKIKVYKRKNYPTIFRGG